jgi:hypothetical protein
MINKIISTPVIVNISKSDWPILMQLAAWKDIELAIF